jgi:hypothetical protein
VPATPRRRAQVLLPRGRVARSAEFSHTTGLTLLLVGRVALRRHDGELARSLLAGIAVWLLVEAAFSVHFGVWFNVGVDAAVLALFSVPLIASGREAQHG